MIVAIIVNCYLLFYAIMGGALVLRGVGLLGGEQSAAKM